MTRTRRLMLGAVCALLLGGCGVHTRAAVFNHTGDPISVTLMAKEGATLRFQNVAPGTTSAFQKVKFDSLAGVAVRVDSGTAKGGPVDLTKGQDNTITVSPAEPPAAKGTYNKDNEYW